MSGDDDDDELDYDMWEGQFEFIGPSGRTFSPVGLLRPPPYLPPSLNGVKKSVAHQWCEDVTDQVGFI